MMEKPYVEDKDLSNLIRKVYRDEAKIGSGSTAAAVREESANSGLLVGGKHHIQKANEVVVALERWIKNNPTARPGDIAAAENVLKDTLNSLGK